MHPEAVRHQRDEATLSDLPLNAIYLVARTRRRRGTEYRCPMVGATVERNPLHPVPAQRSGRLSAMLLKSATPPGPTAVREGVAQSP